MLRKIAFVGVIGLSLPLVACGDSCESVQDQMDQISREMGENPESVLDRADEMQALGEKLEEMGCLEPAS